jgi:hypothetical protein
MAQQIPDVDDLLGENVNIEKRGERLDKLHAKESAVYTEYTDIVDRLENMETINGDIHNSLKEARIRYQQFISPIRALLTVISPKILRSTTSGEPLSEEDIEGQVFKKWDPLQELNVDMQPGDTENKRLRRVYRHLVSTWKKTDALLKKNTKKIDEEWGKWDGKWRAQLGTTQSQAAGKIGESGSKRLHNVELSKPQPAHLGMADEEFKAKVHAEGV